MIEVTIRPYIGSALPL